MQRFIPNRVKKLFKVRGTSFNVKDLSYVALVDNPAYQRNGLKSYAHALHKFNINPTVDGPFAMVQQERPAEQQAVQTGYFGDNNCKHSNVLAKKDVNGKHGTVSAEDIQYDSQYLAPVGIGTPSQTLKLNFDTGSADLWCWSSALSEEIQAMSKHSIFDFSKSKTRKKSPRQTWKIRYGDGSFASGTVGTDTLRLGGLTIENQAIEIATNISPQFQHSVGDGLLGLSFGRINTVVPKPVKTPVQRMISQKDIPDNAKLFTAYLGSWRDKNDPDKGHSFYTFGYIDQEAVKASGEEIHYVDVDNTSGFWKFSSPRAMVNGKEIDRSANAAIADTGTTLAMVSDELCREIYSSIPGARLSQTEQGWVFPSNTPADKLPNLQFAVGSKLFSVQKEDLFYADTGYGMVYGGVQSRRDMGMDIFGDTFLKGIYAIFDQGNKRFGCVQRKDPTQNLVAPSM